MSDQKRHNQQKPIPRSGLEVIPRHIRPALQWPKYLLALRDIRRSCPPLLAATAQVTVLVPPQRTTLRKLRDPAALGRARRGQDPEKYCCHLLHAEPDGSFSVVALVWRPGQATPIHDHITWCVIGVIQGTEQETQYLLRDDGWLEEASTSASIVGEVASLSPPGDIHRVHNDGAHTAISLHIYGTDVSRTGSSVRRVYDLPVIAGL